MIQLRTRSRHNIKRKQAVANASQHKQNLHNIYGTFALEGMTISKETRRNLDRIARGEVSYQQVLQELRTKYQRKG